MILLWFPRLAGAPEECNRQPGCASEWCPCVSARIFRVLSVLVKATHLDANVISENKLGALGPKLQVICP